MASKKLNLKPLSDRLVVEPVEKEERTASGIILPETAKEKPQEGTVLAAGPGRTDDDGKRIPMDVKVGDVVLYAKPQLELLEKATLVITHAGLNTVLEALSQGVPMVGIPITNDQPGVAARLLWSKAGEVVPLSLVNDRTLRRAICHGLTKKSYRLHALRLHEAISRTGGVRRAGEIAEQAFNTRTPVMAQ